MPSVFQSLRYTIRLLLKSPGFTLTAVLILGFGIGANTAIFSLIDAVFLKPISFPQPDRLMQIMLTYEGHDDGLDHCSQVSCLLGVFREQISTPRSRKRVGAAAPRVRGVNGCNLFWSLDRLHWPAYCSSPRCIWFAAFKRFKAFRSGLILTIPDPSQSMRRNDKLEAYPTFAL
jgi:hypothetical protein